MNDFLSLLIFLALLSPLASFLFLMLFGQKLPRKVVEWIACASPLFSFALFLLLLACYSSAFFVSVRVFGFSLIDVEGVAAHFVLHLDPLSMLMGLIITGVGFLIHLYSCGYMESEGDYLRYFAFLNFFIFAMLLLVLAGDLLLLFFGWEAVGLASYFLIGFWYHKEAAGKAAMKAFIFNRIGDIGFLLALLMTFVRFGTSDIAWITAEPESQLAMGSFAATLLALLYFVGATGKSAQLPLYSWLPDAMEGPTPVSALIHAATMVTAGIYLIARLHPLFLLAPFAMQVIGITGAVTALFAALCAVGACDLKRVLAFSTVSQLGLMFVACGAGAFYAAMFHLTMHAFVKALLFLAAGNAIHACQGVTDMNQMGGLVLPLKQTSLLFLIGALALSGIPPFAAFFSKDLILEQEYLAGFEGLFYLALAASILTGVYMMRAYALTFLGTFKAPVTINERPSPLEAPFVMLFPLFLLAALATLGGFLGYSFGQVPLLQGFLRQLGVTVAEASLKSGFVLTHESWIAILGSLTAMSLTLYVYRSGREPNRGVTGLRHQFYLNEMACWLILAPLKKGGALIYRLVETALFVGAGAKGALLVQRSALFCQRMQSGLIRSYIAWWLLGSAVLLMLFVIHKQA